MNIVTDHALWCDKCIQCLSVDNPGARVFGRVLCLACARAIVAALEQQAEADKARER